MGRMRRAAAGARPAWLAAALCLLMGRSAPACTVPVFRYALERWPADAYRIVVFARGPLAPADRDLLDRIAPRDAGTMPAARVVDVNAPPVPPAFTSAWEQVAHDTLPAAVLLHPADASPGAPPLWKGSLTEQGVASLRRSVYSPLQLAICGRLAGGQSAVWVLLRCGNAQRDAAAESMLRAVLDELTPELKLPHELDPDDPFYDAPLLPAVPLQLEFGVLVVSGSEPGAAFFRKMIAPLLPEDAAEDQPVLVPVFGRCRALAALQGAELNGETIREIAWFITSPCSCRIKHLNPGLDLFLPFPWEDVLLGVSEPETVLASISNALCEASGQAQAPATQRVPGGSGRGGSGLARTLVLLVAGAATCAVAGLVTMRRRGGG